MMRLTKPAGWLALMSLMTILHLAWASHEARQSRSTTTNDAQSRSTTMSEAGSRSEYASYALMSRARAVDLDGVRDAICHPWPLIAEKLVRLAAQDDAPKALVAAARMYPVASDLGAFVLYKLLTESSQVNVAFFAFVSHFVHELAVALAPSTQMAAQSVLVDQGIRKGTLHPKGRATTSGKTAMDMFGYRDSQLMEAFCRLIRLQGFFSPAFEAVLADFSTRQNLSCLRESQVQLSEDIRARANAALMLGPSFKRLLEAFKMHGINGTFNGTTQTLGLLYVEFLVVAIIEGLLSVSTDSRCTLDSLVHLLGSVDRHFYFKTYAQVLASDVGILVPAHCRGYHGSDYGLSVVTDHLRYRAFFEGHPKESESDGKCAKAARLFRDKLFLVEVDVLNWLIETPSRAIDRGPLDGEASLAFDPSQFDAILASQVPCYDVVRRIVKHERIYRLANVAAHLNLDGVPFVQHLRSLNTSGKSRYLTGHESNALISSFFEPIYGVDSSAIATDDTTTMTVLSLNQKRHPVLEAFGNIMSPGYVIALDELIEIFERAFTLKIPSELSLAGSL